MKHKWLSLSALVLLTLLNGTFAPIFNPGGGAGGGSNHNILSSTHSDTTGASGVSGDLIRFNTTWERFGIGIDGQCLTVVTGLPTWGSCTSGGAPSGASYITQTPDGTLTGEQALSLLATGIVKNTTTTGVLSIAAAGTDYVVPAGNVATATALAANGTNCPAGQFPLGVDASGASETCTALPTTITGTANEVAASASTGAITLSLPSAVVLSSKTLRIPNSITLPATCTVGDIYFDTDAPAGQNQYGCTATNTWTLQGDGNTGGGGGAPVGATYITQTADGTLTNEQALGALGTGCMGSAATTGVVATRTITGTANEISVANGDCSGNPTISLPSTLTLTGKGVTLQDNNLTIQDNLDTSKQINLQLSGISSATTRTLTIPDASGTLALTTSNVATASALVTNGANCSAGQFPLGVAADGSVETCTALPTTISGTTNEITASAATGAVTLSIASSVDLTSKTLKVPNSITLPATCTVGQIYFDTDATAGQNQYGCTATNTWTLLGDGGAGGTAFSAISTGTNSTATMTVGTGGSLTTSGSGTIAATTSAALAANGANCSAGAFPLGVDANGASESCTTAVIGTVGTTANAIPKANGTGGQTLQATGCTISAGDQLTCPGGFVGGTTGTGVLTLLEGTAPGAGTNVGEHNIYIDSTDSKLKSHENAGSVQTYVRASDNLSVMAATTSAQLLGVLSDESGSGSILGGTSPTITTPTISGAIVFPDGVTQTFNPNATTPGLNVGAQAGDPSTPTNGDVWYNSTTNKFRCRENTVSVDCIGAGGASGDVTDVLAGAGIAVTNSAGPQPSVAWDASTFVNNLTIFNSANASRTITFGLSGATDPVITVSDSIIDVSTGELRSGGFNVTTAANTTSFTNKTMDAEDTGNNLTVPRRLWFPGAGCNNATAAPIWDLPTTNAPTATCRTGTNTQKGTLDFADASNLTAQQIYKLPSTWVGNIDAIVYWISSTTTNDVVWQIAIACASDGDSDDPTFTDDAFTADTTKGTANLLNITASNTVTTTGTCTAGDLAHIRIRRDSAHASDTMTGTARFIGLELTVRETL